jgi:hypothetical protein
VDEDQETVEELKDECEGMKDEEEALSNTYQLPIREAQHPGISRIKTKCPRTRELGL